MLGDRVGVQYWGRRPSIASRSQTCYTETSAEQNSPTGVQTEMANLSHGKQPETYNAHQPPIKLDDPDTHFPPAAMITGTTGIAAGLSFAPYPGDSESSGPGLAFGVDFVKSMAKHGFTLGAAWSTPDYMHFELRWKGPAAG